MLVLRSCRSNASTTVGLLLMRLLGFASSFEPRESTPCEALEDRENVLVPVLRMERPSWRSNWIETNYGVASRTADAGSSLLVHSCIVS